VLRLSLSEQRGRPPHHHPARCVQPQRSRDERRPRRQTRRQTQLAEATQDPERLRGCPPATGRIRPDAPPSDTPHRHPEAEPKDLVSTPAAHERGDAAAVGDPSLRL